MRKKILLYGFSIFAMFFGSGNLVYPLQVGLAGMDNWFACYAGFFCTGIILPFLGLFVIKLHRGDYFEFFGEAGRGARFMLPLVTLSLLGSFGVIPRCITVAHGGLEFIFPQFSLKIFSFCFCLLTYLLCLKEQLMYKVLGKYLTPILLVFIALLIVWGVFCSDGRVVSGNQDSLDVFYYGFVTGYNTMDLLAAYFFSALIFKQIEQIVPEQMNVSIVRTAVKPSIIGAGLLALIYMGFVYLGAAYSHIGRGVSPELILPVISTHLLGKFGSFVISVIIILSCLTTAVALNRIYARYLCDLFNLAEGKYPHMLAVTILVSFFLSTLDFNGIAIILGPILGVCYPGLIALTILSIFLRGCKQLKTIVFYLIVLTAIVI